MKIKADAVLKVIEYAFILLCGITKLYSEERDGKKENK